MNIAIKLRAFNRKPLIFNFKIDVFAARLIVKNVQFANLKNHFSQS